MNAALILFLISPADVQSCRSVSANKKVTDGNESWISKRNRKKEKLCDATLLPEHPCVCGSTQAYAVRNFACDLSSIAAPRLRSSVRVCMSKVDPRRAAALTPFIKQRLQPDSLFTCSCAAARRFHQRQKRIWAGVYFYLYLYFRGIFSSFTYVCL